MTVGDCKKGLSVFTVNWKKYINNKNLREGNLLMLFATLINILPPLRKILQKKVGQKAVTGV
jgi:hypothetical protein